MSVASIKKEEGNSLEGIGGMIMIRLNVEEPPTLPTMRFCPWRSPKSTIEVHAPSKILHD